MKPRFTVKLKKGDYGKVFDLKLPEGANGVMVCKNEGVQLVPLEIRTPVQVTEEYIEKLLEDPAVRQITLIPVGYMAYIHVLSDWRPDPKVSL